MTDRLRPEAPSTTRCALSCRNLCGPFRGPVKHLHTTPMTSIPIQRWSSWKFVDLVAGAARSAPGRLSRVASGRAAPCRRLLRRPDRRRGDAVPALRAHPIYGGRPARFSAGGRRRRARATVRAGRPRPALLGRRTAAPVPATTSRWSCARPSRTSRSVAGHPARFHHIRTLRARGTSPPAGPSPAGDQNRSLCPAPALHGHHRPRVARSALGVTRRARSFTGPSSCRLRARSCAMVATDSYPIASERQGERALEASLARRPFEANVPGARALEELGPPWWRDDGRGHPPSACAPNQVRLLRSTGPRSVLRGPHRPGSFPTTNRQAAARGPTSTS